MPLQKSLMGNFQMAVAVAVAVAMGTVAVYVASFYMPFQSTLWY